MASTIYIVPMKKSFHLKGAISTTSEELANLLLMDAEEYGVDCENPLSILSYNALYCDLLQQEED